MPASVPLESQFPVGSRVMIAAGKYMGRRGDVVRLPKLFPDHCYVLLDVVPRQRKPERRREFVRIAHLGVVAISAEPETAYRPGAVTDPPTKPTEDLCTPPKVPGRPCGCGPSVNIGSVLGCPCEGSCLACHPSRGS